MPNHISEPPWILFICKKGCVQLTGHCSEAHYFSWTPYILLHTIWISVKTAAVTLVPKIEPTEKGGASSAGESLDNTMEWAPLPALEFYLKEKSTFALSEPLCFGYLCYSWYANIPFKKCSWGCYNIK